MQGLEQLPQQVIAASGRVVQLMSGTAVVTVVSEAAGLDIEVIRPVWLIFSAEEGNERAVSDPAADSSTLIAEATRIADGQEPLQRICADVRGGPALVDGVNG